tara:strand:+ start:1060 stop:1257 length:198 start_codon:yes stop_codon:yes gene_type:complete
MGKVVNVEVKLSDTRGDFNRMVKRFSKKVKKAKILDTYREKRYYEKPSVKRRKKRLRAKNKRGNK